MNSNTNASSKMVLIDETASIDLAKRLLQQKQINLGDVVGAQVIDVNSSPTVIVYSYPLVKYRRTATSTELGHCNSSDDAKKLCQAVKSVAGIPLKRRNMIVIINPKSGKGLAQQVWQQNCIEMLSKHANINFKNENVILTTRANEATELAEHWDLSDIDGILAVGGDGTMYEIIQGLMKRKDLSEIRKIPLALISGGSGNAWSCSILYLSGMEKGLDSLQTTSTNMAFLVARGKFKALDLSIAENNTQGKMYSFLSLNWGFAAAVDIESEVCRCCGGLRFTCYAIKLIWCSCATYNATLHYLPLSRDDNNVMSKDIENGSSKNNDDGTNINIDVLLENDLLPSLNTPIEGKGWKTIDLHQNQFFMASQMPTLGGDMIINPNSKLDDGIINVQILDRANACAFTKLLLDVETGEHLNGSAVRVIDCVALRLEPKDGLVVVDGELVEREPVQMQIHKGFLNAFCT